MKKRLQMMFAAKAAILAIAPVHGDLVVYEGFDYAVATEIWGQGTGIGWDGNWAGTETDARGTPETGAGLGFGILEVSGGSYIRPQRYGVAESSRVISAASQTALRADDSTIWFSVLMDPTTGATPGPGYAANSHGAIVFGDTALLSTTNPGTTPPAIGSGGNAVGVSFDGDGNSWSNVGVHGVTYNNGTRTVGSADRIIIGDNTVMIVGEISWAANGTDDVLSLYNITDPSAPLPAAFSTMLVDLDQSAFNLVAIAQGQTEMFDEIRFGESFADVVPLDETDPSLVDTDPYNGEMDVAITTDLVATFDESIALGATGDVTIKNLDTSTDIVISLPGPDPDGTLSVSGDGDELTINPTANLELGDQYAIQIGATVVEDLAGNSYAGIGDMDITTWSFTTDATDLYPPAPDPMTFDVAPVGISETEITMTATTATDDNPVEYLFTNTTLATDSDWQANPTWTDSGLDPDTSYAYTVTARDTLLNETLPSDETSGWTFPEVIGDEILATVFAGRTVSGIEATVNDYTLDGLLDPGLLYADSVTDSPVTVNALFDTVDAQNFFVPQTSTSSAHWQLDVPLNVDATSLSLGNIELYLQSFNSAGTRKTTLAQNPTPHYVTVELLDSAMDSLGSQQIEAPSASRFDWIANFTFGKGIELTANESYTLRILVSGSSLEIPATAGNYVGLDAIRVLTEANSTTPFNDWQAANFPGEDDLAIIGPNADPDMDGVDNLVEYGLNSDPNDPSDFPVTPVATDGTDLWIHYTQVASATDISYVVEWSNNLEDWFDTFITEVNDPEPPVDPAFPVIKASIMTLGDPTLFMRVRIEQL